MSFQATIQAMVEVWPDLSSLVPPSLYWRLVDALRDYDRATDDYARARAADKILKFASGEAALRKALRDAMKRSDHLMGERKGHYQGPTSGDPLGAVKEVLEPAIETLYTDIESPALVRVGKRFPLIVELTRHPSPDAADPQALQTDPSQVIKAVLMPGECEALSDLSQILRMEKDCERSSPAVFYLRPRQSGVQSVLLDLWSGHDLLASQRVTFEAVEVDFIEQRTKPAGQQVRQNLFGAPHPDLIIRVTTAGDRLTYHLHFGDTRMVTIQGARLQSDPQTYRHNLMIEIEGLLDGNHIDNRNLSSEDLRRTLDRIGQRLYRELFPKELQRQYRDFRDHVRTLQIVSDEPWIPWELIKPYDSDGPTIINDDFLCARYEMARWVMPDAAPVAEVTVREVVCIAPRDSSLSGVEREHDDLQSLSKLARNLTPPNPTKGAVLQLLEADQPVSLWHFACHGNYSDQTPNEAPLHLAGNTFLYPNEIVGPAESRLRKDRPFVFLNACRVGRLGLSLTGLGGWAKVLVGDCQVGALIAPLWEVSDDVAQAFSKAFYDASLKTTLAEAVRHARATVRRDYPDDPTWLAYTLYAHPCARLNWAAAAESM